jgi:hypothetical protein
VQFAVGVLASPAPPPVLAWLSPSHPTLLVVPGPASCTMSKDTNIQFSAYCGKLSAYELQN